jgi:hypothetical protein
MVRECVQIRFKDTMIRGCCRVMSYVIVLNFRQTVNFNEFVCPSEVHVPLLHILKCSVSQQEDMPERCEVLSLLSLKAPVLGSLTGGHSVWSNGGKMLTGGHSVWMIGGMMLTGEKRRTDRKSCHSATLSSTDLTFTDLGSNPGLCSERPSNDRLSYSVAVGSTKCTCIMFIHSVPTAQ